MLEIDTPSRLILYWKRLLIVKNSTLVYNIVSSFSLGYNKLFKLVKLN